MKDVVVRLAERGVTLAVTDAALDVILSLAYNPVYGARPIRRWIEKRVVMQLSKMLIQEEIHENCTVYIDTAEKDELAYRVDHNGGPVNTKTVQMFVILIQVPNGAVADGCEASKAVKKMRVICRDKRLNTAPPPWTPCSRASATNSPMPSRVQFFYFLHQFNVY